MRDCVCERKEREREEWLNVTDNTQVIRTSCPSPDNSLRALRGRAFSSRNQEEDVPLFYVYVIVVFKTQKGNKEKELFAIENILYVTVCLCACESPRGRQCFLNVRPRGLDVSTSGVRGRMAESVLARTTHRGRCHYCRLGMVAEKRLPGQSKSSDILRSCPG